MSKTKIQWHEASQLANTIADKAFAHLIEPLEVQREEVAQRAYNRLIEQLGFKQNAEQLITARVLTEASAVSVLFPDTGEDCHVSVRLTNGKDDENVEKYFLAPGRYFYGYFIANEQDQADFDEIQKRYKPVIQQRNKLQETLHSQLEGKSAKHVMKTWPEAAPIVAQYFNIHPGTGVDVSMTQPLEKLLAQFLTPLLAAPQGV